MKICQTCIKNGSINIEWKDEEKGDCVFCGKENINVIDIDY